MTREVAIINRLLPAEMLGRVFRLLTHVDLKNAVLVCKWWREVGEMPQLWSWACIKVDCAKCPCLPEMPEARMMRPVRRMEVRCCNAQRKPEVAVIEEVLLAAARHPGIKELVISVDLSAVDPELLAWTVIQLEEVKLFFTHLSFMHIFTICATITEHSSLKSLYLGKGATYVLSEVDANVLAQAITHLVGVRIGNAQLIPEQLEAIFVALDSSSQLKRLNFCCNNLASLDAHLMARVLNKIEEVELYGAYITCEQITAICTLMMENSKLKVLDLKCIKTWTMQKGHDIAMVDPVLLAHAITQLEEVKLPIRLSPEKLKAIFAALNMPSSRVKRLNMSGINLSSVDANVMANVVNKLEIVDIRITHLTSLQITEILTQSLVTTSLKELYMPGEPCLGESNLPLGELVLPGNKQRRKLLERVRRIIPTTVFHRQCQCTGCPAWSL